uniref:Trafficking protein particle complex subunit 6B n=1 Tax=Odontella aurita TaxID=265563 RepID=A0A7S4KBW7_9STRA
MTSSSAPPPPAPSSGNAPRTGPTHVSEAAYEFLLAEILHWVEKECAKETRRRLGPAASDSDAKTTATGGTGRDDATATETAQSREERAIMSAERAAAKIERLGFDVGYRLCERLAQHKALGPPPAAASSSSGKDGPDPSASVQLEAVKFLCKEFWTEVFRKQIDKLQTNHRGVFVLKDHELRWLRRLPPEDETARVAAIKMLAFPCGLIRGALSNLGIAAVVSCDFLADGKNMAACSFNIKVKS